MPLQLASRLLDGLDIEAAIKSELDTTPGWTPLLPPTAVDEVVRNNASEFATHLRARLEGGLPERPVEYLRASKSRTSSRPIPVLSFTERVVLRAVARQYESIIEPEIAGSEGYQEMLEAPIAAGSSWVAVADVSAFFQYIDHEILADELIAQSGNAELAAATSQLLRFLLNRSFGLPQGYRASDLFANVYVDAAVRRLLREGRSTWRHVDDFRLGAVTANDARAALDELDDTLRTIGLTLNGEKSYIFDKAAYRAWIDRPSTAIKNLQSRAYEALSTYNKYYDDLVTRPSPTDVEVQAAHDVLKWWKTGREEGSISEGGADAFTVRTLLRTAMSMLEAAQDTGGLRFVASLLSEAPQLTPTVATYVRTVAALAPDDATSTVDDAVASGAVTGDWQSLWLLHSLDVVTSGPVAREYVRRLIDSPGTQSLVRVSSAVVAHRCGTLDSQEAGAVYATVGRDFGLPLAAVCDSKSSPLYRVFDDAIARLAVDLRLAQECPF